MNLADLIAEVRDRVGDVAAPYWVPDTRFARFANEAEREACRRARLLVDSTSADLCVIDMQANVSLYPLDRRILFTRRATIDGQSRPLVRLHVRDMDPRGTEWQTETGDVDGWVVGMDTRMLRLFRVPLANGTIRLTVQRLPLDEMVANDDEPEIDEHLHMALLDWMEYRYYSKADSEIRDDQKAAAALASFEREFGPPATGIEEAWAQEHYGFSEDGNVYT